MYRFQTLSKEQLLNVFLCFADRISCDYCPLKDECLPPGCGDPCETMLINYLTEELPSAEHHKLNVAEYIKDNFADVWKQAEKELELPSAEPQIIRCKDCKNRYSYAYCPSVLETNDDDFCSYAEGRKEK